MSGVYLASEASRARSTSICRHRLSPKSSVRRLVEVLLHQLTSSAGYTLLADDSNWNYGALSHYFQPKQVHCRPPKDWFLRSAAVAMGDRRWSTSERVWFSRDLLDKADAWIRCVSIPTSVVWSKAK